MKRIVFMFPGQGSQSVGMGEEFYNNHEEIKALYEKANDSLGKDLRDIMFNGPAETLTETENTQPALLLSSIAAFTLLQQEGIKPVMTIGHSLGEYSALVAAGALSIEEAVPLVATRGRLMEAAVPKGQGTMAAVLGMKEAEIAEQLRQLTGEIVDMANINCPGQIVISGTKSGVEAASERLSEAGARRVIPLNVSGPFHSRLMEPASEEFATSLDKVTIKNASIPVYANVTAAPVTAKEDIKELLVKQLYSPVRFEQSIEKMLEEDIDAFVEVGQGNVLCGLVRKIKRRTKTFSVQDEASLEKFLTWYKEDN